MCCNDLCLYSLRPPHHASLFIRLNLLHYKITFEMTLHLPWFRAYSFCNARKQCNVVWVCVRISAFLCRLFTLKALCIMLNSPWLMMVHVKVTALIITGPIYETFYWPMGGAGYIISNRAESWTLSGLSWYSSRDTVRSTKHSSHN